MVMTTAPMINILRCPPAKEEILAMLESADFRPHLTPMGDPEWDFVGKNRRMQTVLEALRERARAEADVSLPELTDAMYREYRINGTRHGFERPYFERRRRAGRAAFALVASPLEERDFWAGSLIRKLEEICSEESWAVPAHVASETGRDPLCIDLFASETAFNMAEYLVVFPEVIPAALQERIRKRLRTEFFENYVDRADSFHWTTGTSNWNAVCHQGVVGAAMAAETDRALVAEVIHTALPRLARFLGGFTADGGCTEGPGYWSYGFGWFCSLNEQMERQTGGRYSLFEGDALIPKIASYAPATSLTQGQSVNFADSGSAPVSPWLLQYLGQRLGNGDCLRQAAENFDWITRPGGRGFSLDDLRCNFFYFRNAFRYTPEPATPSSTEPKSDHVLPQLGVWVVRGRDRAGHLWELAAKAGYNEEHHNHNDVGSFILHIDGVPLITEIGAPLYVKDFFQRALRYRFLAARSLGHSLPVIGGWEQECGEEYRGNLLRGDIGKETVVFEAELAGAYPAAAGCRRLLRRLTLAKEKGEMLWEDEIECEDPRAVDSALITHASEVEWISGTLARIRRDAVVLDLEAGVDCYWDRMERHDYLDHKGQKQTIHRLVLKPSTSGRTVRLQVRGFLPG
jgi:hypothetical protein